MSENPSNPEKIDSRRFSPEQYEMLKRYSDKKDMTEWNQWRKNRKILFVF